MVLTWVIGANNAGKALSGRWKIDDNGIKVGKKDMSTALIEERIVKIIVTTLMKKAEPL